MSEPTEDLEDVLARIRTETEGQDDVSVGDVLDAFEDRSFGPLLLLIGLVMLSPLGAIPLLPSVLALVVILVAGQRVFGRRHPWLPGFLSRRAVGRERLLSGLDRMKPWARRIDRIVHPRLTALVRGPMRRVLALLVVAVSLSVPAMELVPFAVVLPSLAIICLGLALLGRDGLLASGFLLFALATSGFAVWALWLR